MPVKKETDCNFKQMKNKILKSELILVIILILCIGSSCSNSNKKKQGKKPQVENRQPNGMPPGPPPNGDMPGGMNGHFDESIIAHALLAKEGTLTKENETIEAPEKNQSGVVALKKAIVNLSNNKINTSGNTTSNDQSSFQGLNAAVLARDEGTVKMRGNTITTTGEGANAIFSYGKSTIYTNNDIIDCTAGGAHGIMASGGGTIIAKNVNMITRGRNSGAVATDRGSGTITVDGGKIKATGVDSPGIYSTGKISVSNANIVATGAEVAVIEGSNSIVLNNTQLLCSYQNKWGVMIYQSFSGDAQGVDGHFEMNGGTLKCEDKTGPLFFVTNTNANIFINNAKVQETSGILLKAASSRWGRQGSNGGNATIIATQQLLKGDIVADKNSTIKLVLKEGTSFEGGINTTKNAKKVTVEVDQSSTWSLTGDSYVNIFNPKISDKNVTNIIGNGHTLYYSKTDCPELKGKTYKLKNGGKMKAM